MQPAARPTARAAGPARRRPALPRWGPLEWFIVSQTFIPALLFIPGLTPIRVATRVAAFAIGLLFWALLALKGREARESRGFPPRPFMVGVLGLMVLEMVHPNSTSIAVSVGQVLLYAAVISPAFWAGAALKTPGQFSRLMAILFLCNAISATVGVAQVFRPEVFNPPVIPVLATVIGKGASTYESDDGRTIVRPCGLSDTPGGASMPGSIACLIGLSWALRPIGPGRRAGALGLAFLGVAVIYYTHIRAQFVQLVLCVATLTAMFALQGGIAKAATLVGCGVALFGGAMAWASRSVGGGVAERFGTLFSSDPMTVYQKSRGGFLAQAVTELGAEYPFGAGLGRWGMIQATFGDASRPSIWAEVMLSGWIADGGVLLVLLYGLGIAFAVVDSMRIALTSRDPALRYWGAVVVAVNLSIAASTFSYVPFVAPVGLQFWLLAAALHAAESRLDAAAPARQPKPRRRPPPPTRPEPPPQPVEEPS